MGRALASLATALVLLCGLAGCRRSATPPNVLIILADALRADHLGAYGYGRETSPGFDALARRGTLFTQAHSTTSWTNPAVASLFTGEHPRVLQPGAATFIAPGTRTLAQGFRDAGYRTGAVIANPVLSPDLGFAQGFDDYVPVSGWLQGLSKRPKEPAERVTAAALAWLQPAGQSGGTRPWLLYIHYMDSHWPYEPPIETATRFWRTADANVAAGIGAINAKVHQRAASLPPDELRQATDIYDAAIAHFDAQQQLLLRGLEDKGWLPNTIICVLADHGEELADHGGFLHARTLYEEVLHIPLLILSPHDPGGRRIDAPVPITDIGRTLLDLAGSQHVPFPGRSLLGSATAAEAAPGLLAELVPGFVGGVLHQYALLEGRNKLIVTADRQELLFQLDSDPREEHDQASVHPELLEQMKQELQRSIVPRNQAPVRTPDAASRERLRALGYDL